MKGLSRLEVVACILGMTMAFTVGLVALATGHDGIIVTSVCTAIGALVGYLVRGQRAVSAPSSPADSVQGPEAKNPPSPRGERHLCLR